MTGATNRTHGYDDETGVEPRRPGLDETAENAGRSGDPADASFEEWVDADKARPTLPDETPDGLDDLEEEVRHQAEDLPLDRPGRTE